MVMPLDPLSLPFEGMCLIEASAGTGKTYTISSLYLRLLLGDGEDRSPLSVDEILVVTFTRAATQELRERVRQRIDQAYQVFVRGVRAGSVCKSACKDSLINELLERSLDCAADAQRLAAALGRMDEAAIYTIHGFCQRMLAQHAFESGVLFETAFILDQEQVKLQACADFWRQYFYSADDVLASEIRRHWASPADLLKDINGWLAKPQIRFLPQLDEQDLGVVHQANCQRILQFKAEWLAAAGDLLPLVQQSDVSKKVYNKANLPRWLAQINDFASNPLESYELPDKLEKFSQRALCEKTAKGVTPQHRVFDAADELLSNPPTIKSLVLQLAVKTVRQLMSAHKQQIATLAPDDLLSQLSFALRSEQGDRLAQCIRTLYPVAMIDEFQDTDALQYEIYQRIYAGAQGTALLLIGDPKQAIYGFRGADIFTYIAARRSLQDSCIHTLSTNYRSSQPMVEGVNTLFNFASSAFIYDEDIPFSPVNAASNDDKNVLTVDSQCRDGLQLDCLLSEDKRPVAKAEYRRFFAAHFAEDITKLLDKSTQGFAKMGDNSLQARDIAVLVRDRHEAREMQQALNKHQIPSAFISDDSVLQSHEAMDIQMLLSACAEPGNERYVRAAIATSLFGLQAEALDQLVHDEIRWDRLLNAFARYHQCWMQQGVMAMLHGIMQEHQLAQSLLEKLGGERALTNYLHIAELLQMASVELHGPQSLLNWLREHRLSVLKASQEEHQIRLESDQNLVQIVTIHKSKGLEYPIVYLPFAVNYRLAEQAQLHLPDSQELLVDLDASPENVRLADKERLAEDLRLLYVALTRSIHCCKVGLCNLKASGNRKTSVLHMSALGYLLLQGEDQEVDEDRLCEQLNSISNECSEQQSALGVEFFCLGDSDDAARAINSPDGIGQQQYDAAKLQARQFSGYIENDWSITSYSALTQHQGVAAGEIVHEGFADRDEGVSKSVLNKLSRDPLQEEANGVMPQYSIFTFPRGAQAGSFMHSVFEEISFPAACGEALQQVINKKLAQFGFDPDWLAVIEVMVNRVLDAPLDAENTVCLRSIADSARLVELEFYMSLAMLNATALSKVLQRYGYLQDQPLSFRQLKGMLKGFIDLIFEHDGCYYVLDYKSNYLGDETQEYGAKGLSKEINAHRYDLQYLIYSVALHRFLRQRIPDYAYEKHFGGVYYLFLRGFASPDLEQTYENTSENKTGIFYDLPDVALITELDDMLAGEVSIVGDVQ